VGGHYQEKAWLARKLHSKKDWGSSPLEALANHIHVWGQMSKYLLPDSPSKAKKELLALEAFGMTKRSGLDEST